MNVSQTLRGMKNNEIAKQSLRFFKTNKGEYGYGDKFLGIPVPIIRKNIKKFKNISIEDNLQLLKNKKVLYVRGAKVVSKLSEILNNNKIQCEEIIVYESICKKFSEDTFLPKDSIIIFSSPSTIKCFLNTLSWDNSYTAISIGKTTAKYFPSYITPLISDTTSLESCVKKAIERFVSTPRKLNITF